MQDLRPDQLEPFFLGRRIAPANVDAQAAVDRREQLPVEAGWLAGKGDKADAKHRHRQHDDVGQIDFYNVKKQDAGRLRLDLVNPFLKRCEPRMFGSRAALSMGEFRRLFVGKVRHERMSSIGAPERAF